METWVRDDGRFFCCELGRDLYGHAVVVYFGGQRRLARVRIIAVDNVIEGEKVLATLGNRREKHGYRRLH